MSIRFAKKSDLHSVMEVERPYFPIPKQWAVGDFQEALGDLFFVFEDGEIPGLLVACRRESILRTVIPSADELLIVSKRYKEYTDRKTNGTAAGEPKVDPS